MSSQGVGRVVQAREQPDQGCGGRGTDGPGFPTCDRDKGVTLWPFLGCLGPSLLLQGHFLLSLFFLSSSFFNKNNSEGFKVPLFHDTAL